MQSKIREFTLVRLISGKYNFWFGDEILTICRPFAYCIKVIKRKTRAL